MDPDALIYALPKPKRPRGRPRKTDRFYEEIERCERDGTEAEDNQYLMRELARIALGSIDLGPLMPHIGRRVSQICRICIEASGDKRDATRAPDVQKSAMGL